MAGERQHPEQDPAEGAPDIVDHELQRQEKGGAKGAGTKKRERPPEDIVKGDKIPQSSDEVIESTGGLP